ncbi:MAG: transglycosylase SLT domain-containing protein [Spirochaetes bacterium]|nr:transglycosylase SLT domain-containing protein [Spirochaetota bacterium]
MRATAIQTFTIAIMILLSCMSMHARIYQRTNPDGSIEYYNKKDHTRTPPSRADRGLSSKYDGMIERLSEKHGVDPRLVKCVIRVESDFNSEAVSPAGAMGLMQLMKETADYYSLRDPFDPEANVDTGIRHLKSLLSYFKNDVPLSLAAYHAGIGRVKKRMALPPIQATIDYVNLIMQLYTGEKKNYSEGAVKKLYRRVERDGTIVIYSK